LPSALFAGVPEWFPEPQPTKSENAMISASIAGTVFRTFICMTSLSGSVKSGHAAA
jgi:hypothetical protein